MCQNGHSDTRLRECVCVCVLEGLLRFLRKGVSSPLWWQVTVQAGALGGCLSAVVGGAAPRRALLLT